jgi:hypothetical protein
VPEAQHALCLCRLKDPVDYMALILAILLACLVSYSTKLFDESNRGGFATMTRMWSQITRTYQ